MENGQIAEIPFTAASNVVEVAGVWIDLPGVAQAMVLDPTNAVLVHDFDLEVIGSNSVVYRSWTLDPADPSAPATQTGNDRDNVEKVSITNAVVGAEYMLRIIHKGTVSVQTPLTVGFVGIEPSVAPALRVNHIMPVADNKVAVAWPTLPGGIYRLERRESLTSGDWTYATGEISALQTNMAVEVESHTADARFYRVRRMR